MGAKRGLNRAICITEKVLKLIRTSTLWKTTSDQDKLRVGPLINSNILWLKGIFWLKLRWKSNFILFIKNLTPKHVQTPKEWLSHAKIPLERIIHLRCCMWENLQKNQENSTHEDHKKPRSMSRSGDKAMKTQGGSRNKSLSTLEGTFQVQRCRRTRIWRG